MEASEIREWDTINISGTDHYGHKFIDLKCTVDTVCSLYDDIKVWLNDMYDPQLTEAEKDCGKIWFHKSKIEKVELIDREDITT